MNIWDDASLLNELEDQRDILRKSGKRMTFDCINNRVIEDRVVCKEGKSLGQSEDGSVALITVLRGITSGACKNCEYFETEIDES